MAKYIECEKIIAEIKDVLIEKADERDSTAYLAFVLFSKALEKAPAADVVEVVRCKDCKHFDQYSYLYSDDPSGFGKCEKIHMDIDLTIDDFCSYGERRKEDA